MQALLGAGETIEGILVEKALVKAGVRLAVGHEVVQASLVAGDPSGTRCDLARLVVNVTEGLWCMVRVPVLLWHNLRKFREAQLAM